jgi:hypothetical protein
MMNHHHCEHVFTKNVCLLSLSLFLMYFFVIQNCCALAKVLVMVDKIGQLPLLVDSVTSNTD